jgi:hypothetical protein
MNRALTLLALLGNVPDERVLSIYRQALASDNPAVAESFRSRRRDRRCRLQSVRRLSGARRDEDEGKLPARRLSRRPHREIGVSVSPAFVAPAPVSCDGKVHRASSLVPTPRPHVVAADTAWFLASWARVPSRSRTTRWGPRRMGLGVRVSRAHDLMVGSSRLSGSADRAVRADPPLAAAVPFTQIPAQYQRG